MTSAPKDRATPEQCDELHALVAEALIEQIQAWKEDRLVEQQFGEDGDINYVKVFPPALLAQAIKFLKDNKIDAPATASKKLKTLSDTMPSLPGDNVVSFNNR